MRLLSIDVGIKNLSFCLFNIDLTNKVTTIVSWDNINLTEKETALCCYSSLNEQNSKKKKSKILLIIIIIMKFVISQQSLDTVNVVIV